MASWSTATKTFLVGRTVSRWRCGGHSEGDDVGGRVLVTNWMMEATYHQMSQGRSGKLAHGVQNEWLGVCKFNWRHGQLKLHFVLSVMMHGRDETNSCLFLSCYECMVKLSLRGFPCESPANCSKERKVGSTITKCVVNVVKRLSF